MVTPPSEDVKGSHGYDPNQPALHASFVAWGAGIKPGSRVGTIRNLDVAPTIAALLEFTMPEAEGVALKAALVR